MRLLEIRSDSALRDSPIAGFQNRYIVDQCDTVEEGIAKADVIPYDLIIVDKEQGYHFLELCQGRTMLPPVIFYADRATSAERAKGLNAGADEFLTKALDDAEMDARIRAVLRRGSGRKSENLEVGDLTLDPVRRKVTRGERDIFLSRTEYDLLELLMRNPGTAVLRRRIEYAVWPDVSRIGSNVVDVTIRHLRKKLNAADEPELIHTLHGIGYMLEFREY